MTGAIIAACAATVNKCSLSGSLSKTAAPSSGRVTSDTVTVTVPIASDGYLNFNNFIDVGTISYEYSLNAAAFAPLTDGVAFLFASGDTIAVRITGATAGESGTFTVQDNTTLLNIGTYTLTAS